MAQQEFTGTERERCSDDQVKRSRGCLFRKATNTATCYECEPGTHDREGESSERLEYHVGMVRQEKRWYEMPVKELLIRDKGTR